ncbi:MAG TPA: nucleotidyltransferase family protein [Vicinamibacterales bacterium]|nr:nucleotidyltransferase family protein [Vicinamibacterales bacterium]
MSPRAATTSDRRGLLRAAALAPPDAALAAWTAWRAGADRWRFDPASDWWLPLVWWNLREVVTDAADASLLREHYRRAWIHHQHLIARVAPALDALHREGIETLLLKGAALAIATYERPALRPFGDVDVLVAPDAAPRAHAVLEGIGWTPFRTLVPTLRAALHGLGYTDAYGATLDLHAYALVECCAPGIDAGFWSRSESVQVGGIDTRVLSPADQLLHVCTHGLRFHGIPTSHWMADATMILRRAANTLDWRVLVEEARARRITFQVGRALDALDPEYAPAPARVRVELGAAASIWWERVEYRAKRRPTRPAAVVQSWCTERRSRTLAPNAVVGATTRLRAAAGAASSGQLVTRAALALVGLGRHGSSRTFDAYGRRIQIDLDEGVDAAVLFDRLADRLPPFKRLRARDEPDRLYRVLPLGSAGGADTPCRLLVNTAPLGTARTIDEAADCLVTDLQTFLAVSAPDRIFIHAGVVAVREHAVLLPGVSGAGKSTLVDALVAAGAHYLSDEFAVVDPDGRIHPYARPIRLRTAGGPDRRIRLRDRHLWRSSPVLPAGPLLFTNFDATSEFNPAPIAPGTALLRLLSHCPSAQARPAETLAALRRVVSEARAWSSPRPDTGVVVRMLMEEMPALTAR